MTENTSTIAQNRKFISQVDLDLGEEESLFVQKCLDNRWLSEGPMAEQFAAKLSDLTGAKHVTFAPNGTLALYLSLVALDLPPGSEVILPSFTFYASASSCIFAGLKPVFVDVDPHTYNVSPEAIEKAITPQTSAIMPIHIYGQSCDVDAVLHLARKHGLRVIEDAAQAIGVRNAGRHVGALGDIGIFSFFSDKVITTGEGAAIVTNDSVLFEKIKLLRNQGRPHAGTFIHPALGMNFRITDMQAALGIAQLNKLPKIIERRLDLWQQYETALGGDLPLRPMKVASFSNLVPFRFAFCTSAKDAIFEHLNRHNVATRSFFYPMHKQPQLASPACAPCPVSETLYDEGVCLPVHAHISDEDVQYICALVRASC